MKTAHDLALERVTNKLLDELRIETQERIDKALDNIKDELINKPLPEKESKEDGDWHISLINLHDRLIYFRRTTLKIETFKNIDMEELNKLLFGY